MAPCPLDGWTPPPGEPSAPAPPRVPGVSLGERLGQGGFAIVWAGVSDEDGAPVAVKVGMSTTPMLEERFRREADALERIGPPHVARFHRCGRLDDGRPYLVMERLFGRTLASELAALAAPPDPGWAAARADAVLAALEAAHGRGAIHRDLKPENLFIERRSGAADERVVLLDFGLTKRSERTPGDAAREELLTRSGVVLGTPEYMAPEQFRGEAVDVRADVYAFGVILFELLTLRLPFAGDGASLEHAHLTLRPERPGELAPVPAALEELTLACLAKDRERRPSDAPALRRALAAARATFAPAGPGAPPARAAPPADSTGARLIAGGRSSVVLLVADTTTAASPVIASVTGRKGFITRQRGSRYVAVFSGKDTDHPAQAALAAARELAGKHGARAALHLASVTLRRRARGAVSAYGAAVERPETWLPPEPWSGVALSAEIERALPAREDGDSRPASAEAEPSVEIEAPLAGRDDVLAAIAESARAAFDGTCPGLFTLIGDTGLGKSRLAAEAASAALRCDAGALVVSLRAAQPLLGDAARDAAGLLGRVLDAPAEAPPDVAAFCRERLGAALGEATWPSVAAALGWSPLPARGAPASFHHGVVQALGEALRRRAQRGPVAVIVDDAHWADDALVDALEYATLDGAGVALWVLVAAHPRFEQVRRAWGARTQRHERAALAPLDDAAAMALAAELLRPAEYPPAETLRRLARWAGNNPACLMELVRSLKRAGLVKRRVNAGTHYVATAELDSLPPSPAWQWLAERRLDALSPELAACVRLCAVLGDSFARSELEQILDSIARAGDAGTPIDAGYGLSALVEQTILERGAGERYSFQSAVFRDAVVELLDPAERAQIHLRALAYFTARVEAEGPRPELLAPLARHAGGCGAREAAADACLTLADLAFARHRHVEADRHYTAALSFAAADDARRRARALAGRGKSRYRVDRTREATDDLAAARALAVELGDDASLADVLLEEAAALDWAGEFERSAERVEEARALVNRLGVRALVNRLGARALEGRVLVAEGRSCFRRGRVAEAVELLTRGAASAEAEGDYGTRIVALLLLSPALMWLGELDLSNARFDETFALASSAEDWPHLCAACTCRIPLRAMRRELDLAMADMRHAIALARELGNPVLERHVTLNAAELLHASDHGDEALELARRAHVLERRFFEHAAPECSLLLARILVSRRCHDDASRHLSWIERSCPPDPSAPSLWAFYRAVHLALCEQGLRAREPSASADPWEDVLSRCRGGLLAIELVELLSMRAEMAIAGGRPREAACALQEATAQLDEAPGFRARLARLAAQLDRMAAPGTSG
ncbi:serine/threonine-protein kinase [Sorangium atrum]|uniref:Protein kinase n=1 Tax=Sorangium atrum TaxID=2995308 RepID=A0ABT5BXP7_9BACT|nr:serine/threonine-protein kinase [Sorangium aterium]MDC0677721.1 protein kinase [Sorangium aterium]